MYHDVIHGSGLKRFVYQWLHFDPGIGSLKDCFLRSWISAWLPILTTCNASTFGRDRNSVFPEHDGYYISNSNFPITLCVYGG